MLVAFGVAIGCGSQPQPAAATDTDAPAAPIQVAQSPDTGAAPAAAGASRITGTVRFAGAAPARQAVKMSADPVCQQQHSEPVLTEEVLVADGKLQNALVYVKEGVTGTHAAPATPVVLDQSGCWYAPHVFGLQVNQPLEIVNSDATLHNVNAKPKGNTPFNLAQPVKGMKTTKKFAKAELGVPFKCNVHPWMSAYAGVFDHPFFAVSQADGSFAIPNLPAGSYVLEAWHEKLGTATQQVTVGDGASATVDFSFQAQ